MKQRVSGIFVDFCQKYASVFYDDIPENTAHFSASFDANLESAEKF